MKSVFGRILGGAEKPGDHADHAHGQQRAQQPSINVAAKEYLNSKDLPPYEEVLTAPDKPHSLSESLHATLAAIRLDDDTALVLCDARYLGKHDCRSLADRLRQRYARVGVGTASSSVLLTLYGGVVGDTRRDRNDSEIALSISLFQDEMERAAQRKATDVHFAIRFETGFAAILNRVDGLLRNVSRIPATNALQAIGAAYTKLAESTSRSEATFNQRTMQSCAIPIELAGQHYKLRYQSIPVNDGLDVVLRLLRTSSLNSEKTLSLEELGYEKTQQTQLEQAARKTVGVIVVSGVTGSGKSTTLKHLMTLSPNRLRKKSYSIEDPVEYKMYGVSQIPVRRSANSTDSTPFTAAMRVVLRADPDVVMVGEVRDSETCSLMKTMVHSGHQVMTSVHAASAIDVVQRLTSEELGLSRENIGSRNFLSAIIYQRLVPLLCPKCKVPFPDAVRTGLVRKETRAILEKKFGLDTSGMFAMRPDGCDHCSHLGTKGVTVVAEIITPDATLLQMLRDGRDMDAELYWRQQRSAAFDQADCWGKTAFEHGLYKASCGRVDPQAIEDAFEPFETYQIAPPQLRVLGGQR